MFEGSDGLCACAKSGGILMILLMGRHGVCVGGSAKAGAAEKFTQDRGAGDGRFVLKRDKIGKIFAQPLGRQALRVPLRNRHQRGERLLADDAQLIPKEGIEHKIRALLGGIDPFELDRARRLLYG